MTFVHELSHAIVTMLHYDRLPWLGWNGVEDDAYGDCLDRSGHIDAGSAIETAYAGHRVGLLIDRDGYVDAFFMLPEKYVPPDVLASPCAAVSSHEDDKSVLAGQKAHLSENSEEIADAGRMEPQNSKELHEGEDKSHADESTEDGKKSRDPNNLPRIVAVVDPSIAALFAKPTLPVLSSGVLASTFASHNKRILRIRSSKSLRPRNNSNEVELGVPLCRKIQGDPQDLQENEPKPNPPQTRPLISGSSCARLTGKNVRLLIGDVRRRPCVVRRSYAP